jgi:hypothetical protein
MFAVRGGALVPPTIRESIAKANQGINQLDARFPVPVVATVGAIAGGINSGTISGAIQGGISAALTGAVQNQFGGVFNQLDKGLAQAAGALAGIPNPAAFVQGAGFINGATLAGGNTAAMWNQRRGLPASGRTATTDTYAGTINADNPSEKRTLIIDATTDTVELMKDSFLQGLQGGLSSILGQGVAGLLGNLPSAMQNLLSTTGLTGALGGALSAIDGALGNALNKVSGALGSMAGQLAQGLGTAISGIPGVGPIFEQLGKGIGDFTNNLTGALNGMPPELKGVLAGTAASVGANLVGKLTKSGKLNAQQGRDIAKKIVFQDNPAGQLNTIASVADKLDKKTFKTTNNTIFGDVASQCRLCAREFDTKLVKKTDATFGINCQVSGNIKNVATVNNGVINSNPCAFMKEPPVKRTKGSFICHEKGISDYYYQERDGSPNIENFDGFCSMAEALASDPRCRPDKDNFEYYRNLGLTWTG